MEYIAYLHKDRESDYGVSFPDFPGCISAGSTLEEARSMAGEALALHMAGMVEDGKAVPVPSSLDDLRDDPDMAGAMAVLIAAETPDPTVRFNITAKQSQLAEIDRVAKGIGMSRSAYLVYAAVQTSMAFRMPVHEQIDFHEEVVVGRASRSMVEEVVIPAIDREHEARRARLKAEPVGRRFRDAED